MANSSQIVEKVIQELEKFYNEGTDKGEDVFNSFAAKHKELFTSESDALNGENKLEWTSVFKEFCGLFESHIESKYT